MPRSLCRFVSQVCRKLTRLGALVLLVAADEVLAVLLALVPELVEPPPKSLTSCEKARSSRCRARSRCRDCQLPALSVASLASEVVGVVLVVAAGVAVAALVAAVAGLVWILLLGPCAFSSWTSCWSNPARPPL